MCVPAAIGFNVETVTYKNIKFQVWDLGGQTSIRPYWRCYYPNTQVRRQYNTTFVGFPLSWWHLTNILHELCSQCAGGHICR